MKRAPVSISYNNHYLTCNWPIATWGSCYATQNPESGLRFKLINEVLMDQGRALNQTWIKKKIVEVGRELASRGIPIL